MAVHLLLDRYNDWDNIIHLWKFVIYLTYQYKKVYVICQIMNSHIHLVMGLWFLEHDF